jgi:hypothetical protein
MKAVSLSNLLCKHHIAERSNLQLMICSQGDAVFKGNTDSVWAECSHWVKGLNLDSRSGNSILMSVTQTHTSTSSNYRHMTVSSRNRARCLSSNALDPYSEELRFLRRYIWRMPSSGLWLRVGLVQTDFSLERVASSLWIDEIYSSEQKC